MHTTARFSIVRPVDADGVSRVVSLARETGVELAVPARDARRLAAELVGAAVAARGS